MTGSPEPPSAIGGTLKGDQGVATRARDSPSKCQDEGKQCEIVRT